MTARSPVSRNAIGTMALAICVLAFALVSGESVARDLSKGEEAALADRIESFGAAVRARDFDEVLAVMPPVMIDAVAQSTGMSADELRAAISQEMAELLKTRTLLNFSMSVENAEHRSLPDGTPYVLLPTRTVLEAEGRKIETSNHTLALMQNGDWYLVRLENSAQVKSFTDAFPEFSGQSFPTGTWRVLQQ
mgnify:CR=1 FL=1